MSDPLRGRTSDAMQMILDLEDEAPDALREVLPGATVPFWAQVRVQINWALSAEQTGSVEVAAPSTWSRRAELERVIRGYLPSRWDAARRARTHDVLFYVNGGTLAHEGDRVRNWLVDDFAQAADDAIVVQHRPLPSPQGKPLFRPTLSMESATARSRWKARGASPVPGYAEGASRLLAEFARLLSRPTDAFAKLHAAAVRAEILRPFQQAELSRLLERVRPRVVLYDNGSYSYNGESVGLMKDAGIHVAEPQHGWIGPSHAAYNYGRIAEEAEFRRALPDELLTFGDFWSESVRHPGTMTSIGKPHLERQVADVSGPRRARILVVSSRAEPEKTDSFVVAVRAAVGERFEIVFRPHPGEVAQTAERYPMISADPDIHVDRVPDVYESLKKASVVVGVASTVLFEARAFGCVVIPRESSFTANVIGDAFGACIRDADDLVQRLDDATADDKAVDPRIWAPGAVDAFRRWLNLRCPRDDIRRRDPM